METNIAGAGGIDDPKIATSPNPTPIDLEFVAAQAMAQRDIAQKNFADAQLQASMFLNRITQLLARIKGLEASKTDSASVP